MNTGKVDLKQLLAFEMKRYLEKAEAAGGTAKGFRQRVRKEYEKDPLRFNSLVLDALMEAATRRWQASPRDTGPDLFAINGLTIPEHLTRPSAASYAIDEDDETDQYFEKVDSAFATVQDLRDDATIKLRKAAQAGTAAERKMKAADEALRRARGNVMVLLREIADQPISPSPTVKPGRSGSPT
jgi:hypothetical protein